MVENVEEITTKLAQLLKDNKFNFDYGKYVRRYTPTITVKVMFMKNQKHLLLFAKNSDDAMEAKILITDSIVQDIDRYLALFNIGIEG